MTAASSGMAKAAARLLALDKFIFFYFFIF
jgi:hypothetical protein